MPTLNIFIFAHCLFYVKHEPISAPLLCFPRLPPSLLSQAGPTTLGIWFPHNLGPWPIPSYAYPLLPLPPMPFMACQESRAAIPVTILGKGPGASTAPKGEVPGISGEFDGQISHAGLSDSRKARSKSCHRLRKLYDELRDHLPKEPHTKATVVWM